MTLYVIRSGVISEEDLDAIKERPLAQRKEIYEILATICENAAGVFSNRWNRENGMESLRISYEALQWKEKAKAKESQAKFSERCFDIFGGPYESMGLSALVESRFQHG